MSRRESDDWEKAKYGLVRTQNVIKSGGNKNSQQVLGEKVESWRSHTRVGYFLIENRAKYK